MLGHATAKEPTMPRFFNVAGPCYPDKHYMLPWERRIPDIRKLVDDELYFVIHAPRQVGKTTSFRHLAAALTAEGRYAALHASCETGQAAGRDVEMGVQAVIDSLASASSEQLPEQLAVPSADSSIQAPSRLKNLLEIWSQECPRPVVLFLDEIDALLDEVLISVLRQLRSGYPTRPKRFVQSVALIGLRDVRDYKASLRQELDSLGTSSPFNVKVESITLRNFHVDEVAELYRQHTDETGQPFTDEAMARAFELTQGQPWLVNALARQVTEKDLTDRREPITAAHIEAAAEALIERRDTHLDSLIDKLREPRVRRVIEPILAGDTSAGEDNGCRPPSPATRWP
jgi:type II secretory pathway predicted ATPase ExeA